MRNWLRKLEVMAAAVAFAEEGEWKMAESILEGAEPKRVQKGADLSKRHDQRARKQPYRV
ncbi:MAG: hypothetical protein HY914_06580 [Desulfomonile tiedjei]|nr:hypothetical protein [Desulfomonile tiedjei]